MMSVHTVVLIRGGGDLATGVAARLHRCGFRVLVTEIEAPRAVRRLVSLAEAVYSGEITIEDLRGRLVRSLQEAQHVLEDRCIPVMVDPGAECRLVLGPAALVDGRMTKAPPDLGIDSAPMVIGLGPGFTAGTDCHAVVETQRGHHMGRVLWQGRAEDDTGQPEAVHGVDQERVLRSPRAGRLRGRCRLGEIVHRGSLVAEVEGWPILAAIDGVLRGLAHDGLVVAQGEKVGDLDPRLDPAHSREISDKALAVGGGVLEALLSRPGLRDLLRP